MTNYLGRVSPSCFLQNVLIETSNVSFKNFQISHVKDIKKENFIKNLMSLIEANHQISMTSDHSVSSNNSFKTLLNAKSFNLFLTL